MRVAVIGTGFGERVVARVYRDIGWDVTVLHPRDMEGLEAACASKVDLVSVHSPPFLHRAHVSRALDHGRAVLCDKPFGRDAGEARAMRDRARETGVLHFLNFEFRSQPSRRQLKALLDEGAIGPLRHVSWSFIGNGLRQQRHRWLFDASQGGGWIGAYGSHAIDTLRWLFGSEVAACGGVSRTETPVRLDRGGTLHDVTAEDAFTAWFAMAGGGTVSFDTAFSTPVNLPHRLTLLGSEGSLELLNERVITITRPDGTSEAVEFPAFAGDTHEPGLRPWLRDVTQAIVEGRQIGPSFDDGLATAEVMDRLRATMIRV